jgi:hypothetical protein
MMSHDDDAMVEMVELNADALARALDGLFDESQPRSKLREAASNAAPIARAARKRDESLSELLTLDPDGSKSESIATAQVSIDVLEALRRLASQQENTGRKMREMLTLMIAQAAEGVAQHTPQPAPEPDGGLRELSRDELKQIVAAGKTLRADESIEFVVREEGE